MFWFQAVKRMKEGCAEGAIFYIPREREDQQWGNKLSGSVTNLETYLLSFLFWSSLCCSCLALPSSLCFQNVLWDFHCLSLAVYVVISNCSHSIFNFSRQWISAKEISCSYRMLVDNINTWELLRKIRFRVLGSRVVSCNFFFLKCLILSFAPDWWFQLIWGKGISTGHS